MAENNQLVQDIRTYQSLISRCREQLKHPSQLGNDLHDLEATLEALESKLQAWATQAAGLTSKPISGNQADDGLEYRSGILSSITDGVLALNRNWEIAYINPVAARTSGYQPEELIGKNFWETFPEVIGSSLEAHYRQVMTERTPVQFEMKGILRGLWYLIRVSPSPDGITVLWVDQTFSKLSELETQELLLENKRHKTLLEAIFEADPGGLAVLVGEELRFVQTNPAYRYIVPDPVLDPVGMTYDEVWPVKSKYGNRDRFREVLKTGKPFQVTGIEHSFPDGSSRIFTMQARRIEWGDEPAVLIILWDVTDLKKAEGELRSVALFPDQNPNPLLRIDAKGSLAYINPPARIIFPDFEMGQPVSQYWLDIAREILQRGESRSLDLDIGDRTINFHAVAFPDYGYVNFYGRDVTDLRQSTDSLHKANDRLKSVLGSILEVYGLLDWDWTILDINPVAEQHYFSDYPPGAMIGKNLWEVLPQAAGGEFYRWFQMAKETGQAVHFEAGSQINHHWYEVHLYPRGDQFELYMHDATERRRVDEQLIYHASLVDNLHDAIIGMDPDLHVTAWNKAAEKLYGYRAEEVIGQSAGPILLSEFSAEQQAEAIAQIASGVRFTQETRQVTKTGRHILVEASTIAQRNRQGEIVGYVSAIRDITHRKRVEQALARRERAEKARLAELEAVMDAVPAFMWITHDRLAREMTGNQVTYDLMRVPRGQDLSKTGTNVERLRHFKIFRNGKELVPAQMPVQVTAATGKPVRDYEFQMVFEDGEVRHLLGNVEPLFDETGQPAGAVSAFIDISKRKEIEQALRASEARFQLALGLAPITVFALDRELRHTWTYHPGFGLSPEQVIGKREDEIGVIENAEALMAIERGVIENGQGVSQEFLGKGQDGWVNFLLLMEPTRDATGRVTGLTGAAINITATRKLESRQIAYATQVEVQQRLLEQREQERLLIARDLHDGPMQELLGIIYTLQASVEAETDPAKAETLGAVVGSLQALLGDIRTYASELRPPALVSFGLDKAILAHQEGWQEKNPGVRVDLYCDDFVCWLPDPVKLTLYRIYQETINNITRHAGANEIQIRFECLRNEAVRLTIQDNGRGFPVPDDWLTMARGGHLGLVGMRERAKAVGGNFEIFSQPGAGTTIQVEVPLGTDDSPGPGKGVAA